MVDDNVSLAASCGRDRTIQIFHVSAKEFSLEQSLINEHTGPIRKVLFAENGSILASMSSDRTIVLHKKVLRTDRSIAFVSIKTMNLKASPTSMSLLSGVTPCLLVSAMDRCIRKISVTEGITTHMFKTLDNANGESVPLNRLTVGTLGQQSGGVSILAGFSSADGSIKLYDVETGSLLAVTQGQSIVSGLALAQTPDPDGNTVTRLISTGFDGTIMFWKLTTSPQDESTHTPSDGSRDADPFKPRPLPSLRLVRRVLSKAEIAGFQRSLKEKNEDDSNLPRRNLSPSRLRRKRSRYGIPDPPQVFEPETPTDRRCQDSSARDNAHQSRIKLASPPLSPKTNLQSIPRRSSLDERHRRTTTAHTNYVNSTAKQISNSLQDFRNRMSDSRESLSSYSAQALARELQATLDAISPRAERGDHKIDQAGSESFDDYLARLIDERLALRSKPEDQTNATEGARAAGLSPTRSCSDLAT